MVGAAIVAGSVALAAGCTSGESVAPWSPSAGEVEAIVAQCESATGDLGERLAAIDKGSSPVEAYKVASLAESTCHESAAKLSRPGQVSSLVEVCGNFAQVGEVTASAAKSALDDPRPATLASLEEAVATLAITRERCLAAQG